MDEGFLKPNTGATSICYHFFKDDDSNRQDGAKAICAILHQLFIQKPALLHHATRSFQDHGVRLCTMFGALWSILEKSAADPAAGEIVCVLDALDECREEARKELIQTLTNFYSSQHKARTHLKFLATSRPYADIERAFHRGIKDMTSIRLRGEDESKQISKEIDLVINIRVPHICGAREPPFDIDVQQFLISGLKSFDNRTYLWLHLTLDVIENTLESTIHDLRMLINRLPRSVEEAYEKILMRVKSSEYAQTARSLLHIVLAALRPLTLGEIQIALAINKKLEHGEHCESYNDLVLQSEDAFRVKLRNLCGLFLSIVDSKVYLIHQTAKEFLISKNSNDRSTSLPKSTLEVWRHSLAPLESNLILLKICLCYLLLCGAEVKSNSLRYAARWIYHFRSARSGFDESILQSILDICEPRSPSFSKWWPEVSSRFRIETTDSWTSLMVASFVGLVTVVKFSLEKRSAKPDIQDENGQTALHLALEYRHLDVAKILVGGNGIALSIPDSRGCTPLHLAAASEQLDLVKMLINTNSVALNPKDNAGLTPLHAAAYQGCTETVKLLVEKPGVELNLQDKSGRTPLHTAAYRGHTETVKSLVEKPGVELNLQDKSGRTPLHFAAQWGHLGLVNLLIEKRGIEPDLKDQHGRTLLHMAAEDGYIEIVMLLLEKQGLMLDLKDKNGQTPLHVAAQNGYTETVELLLVKQSFSADLRDKNEKTPLHMAAQNGHTETIKLLVKRSLFWLNSKDINDQTPLHMAAETGCTDTVKLLVEQQGVELNLRDKNGRTPLHLALLSQPPVSRGCIETVRVLIEKENHVFDFDRRQGLSLRKWALSKGYLEYPPGLSPPLARKRRREE